MKFFLFFTLFTLGQFTLLAQNGSDVPYFIIKVHNDIFQSMTNGKLSKPRLLLTTDSTKIIFYTPDFNTITMSEKFIRVMRSFKSDSLNAVAHILGHELAHVILQQGDFLKIGSGYADDSFNQKVRKYGGELKDSLGIFERQADEQSIFYAHISGYQTTHIGKQVLEAIYSSFSLKNKKLKGYPELQERISMIDSSAKRMDALLKIYDFALIALMRGQFDQAIFLFDLILKEKFYSIEVYNNIAVAYMLKAQQLSQDKFPYELPFQIDFHSKLSQQRDGTNNVKDLLNLANEALKSAIQMDPNYYSTRLNELIWKYLSGVSHERLHKDIEYFSLDFPSETSQWVLYAISIVSSGQIEKGKKELLNFSGKNRCAYRVICQMDSLQCKSSTLKTISVNIPEINLSNDPLYKQHGIEFKNNFLYAPYGSWKVHIYQNQGISFYNIQFSTGPSFMISELDKSYFKEYSTLNFDDFSGWEIYSSKNVTFVSNKQVALKYIDNQLVKTFKL